LRFTVAGAFAGGALVWVSSVAVFVLGAGQCVVELDRVLVVVVRPGVWLCVVVCVVHGVW
jgi:hypothetical protein